ncbi:hypothetical protein Noda2021_05210 [Candidatus Dependentiae bacterium Noda2021]|nr:hypothetical protein Noda2021_05210 [Candidatus Dependentiae bacterium Noda2021]
MQPAREQRLVDGSTRFIPAVQIDKTVPAAQGSKLSSVSVALDTQYPTYVRVGSPAQPQEPMYAFRPGKTLYLAYEKGVLRPQKGSFGKTQSGLPLKNNVQQKDILLLNETERRVVHQQILENEISRDLQTAPKIEPPKKLPGNNWVKGY